MSLGQSASLKGGTNTSGYDLKNTTQNATLSLNGPEIASKETYFGLLFWRAFTQLLGGMGIVLLFVAIFPHLGVAGRQLYYAEATGPTKEPLTPKVRNTAKILWGIYLGFVGLETCLLMVAGMPLYDALCTSFTTLATGGFHPLAAGIVAYESPAIELIVVAFMFIGATSFVLHYRLIYNRDLECYAKDSEFRFYVLIMAAAVFIIALWGGVEGDLLHRIRLAGFHVVSVMTTTGFTNTFDYDHWSVAANMVLVLLMLIGGSVGSTAGAIKVGRVLLVLKYTHRELVEMLHPSAVRTIRMAGVVVQENVLISILFFTLLYLIVFFSSSLALAVVESSDKEFDLISAISAVATCMGGVGPGLGDVAFDFSRVTSFGKVIGIFCMYIGRMEILPVMLLFIPDLWRR
jgi:trk system potassium uptake protein TrkH